MLKTKFKTQEEFFKYIETFKETKPHYLENILNFVKSLERDLVKAEAVPNFKEGSRVHIKLKSDEEREEFLHFLENVTIDGIKIFPDLAHTYEHGTTKEIKRNPNKLK